MTRRRRTPGRTAPVERPAPPTFEPNTERYIGGPANYNPDRLQARPGNTHDVEARAAHEARVKAQIAAACRSWRGPAAS